VPGAAAAAAAVALVQCGNVAGDTASKGKQTEKHQSKRQIRLENIMKEKDQTRNRHSKWKESYVFRVLATLYVGSTRS
jgi:hypothetical protein